MSSPGQSSPSDSSSELSLAPQTKRRRRSITFDSPKDYVQRKAVRLVKKTRTLLSSPTRDSDGEMSPRGKRIADVEGLDDEDRDPSIPLLTVPCKFYEKLRGHLHVYDNTVLFTHHDEEKDEKLNLTLSISTVDTLKRNGRALSIGSKKWKMNLYSLDERKRVIALVKSLQQYSSREEENEDTLSERSTITDELEDFEIPPDGQEYIEDPIVQAIHHKLTAIQDYEEPKDTTVVYDKVFQVPLSVITAYLFSNKSNFFHGLQPPEEVVSDYGTWIIDEEANMALKTAYFDTKKQGISIAFTQNQRIHWTPDGSLIFQCDHQMKGFPSSQNMSMSSIWKLTSQGSGSSRIVAYALVVFTGFFLGKDRARRESIEGIADACQKTEDKLAVLLGLRNPEIPLQDVVPRDAVSNIQRILQEVEVAREYFSEIMDGLGPPPQTTQLTALLYASLAIQIVIFFTMVLKWLF